MTLIQTVEPMDARAGSDRGDGNPDSGFEGVLRRLRAGDRDTAAEFVTRFESRIRRRIRGKLSPAMRRVFDSQDILSTVGRRLLEFVGNQQVEATCEGQLWSLIFEIANNAVIDKSRVMRKLQRAEGQDSGFAHHMLSRMREAERQSVNGAENEIEAAMHALEDETDRKILALWLLDASYEEIADHLDFSPNTIRKRWERMRFILRARLAPEARN